MGPGSAPKAGGFWDSRAGLGRPRASGRASAPHPTPRVPPRPLSPLLAADLFDILLPMLNIYQEFGATTSTACRSWRTASKTVTLTSCSSTTRPSPTVRRVTLETFLTYPMFQVRHPACRLYQGACARGWLGGGSGGVATAESQACRAGQGLGWRGLSHPRPWLQV